MPKKQGGKKDGIDNALRCHEVRVRRENREREKSGRRGEGGWKGRGGEGEGKRKSAI